MQTKYLLSMVLCFSTPILAWAENVSANNPLQAKVVSYKHDKNYDVEIVQTNLPALNKQLENLFCDHAFGNENDWEDCQKQDIRQSIEYDYKYRSEDEINHYTQNYQYFHQDNKQYFQVCTMKYKIHLDYCKIYDITNPKKAVLLDKENMPMIAGMGIGSKYIQRGNHKYFLSCLHNGGACDLYDLKNPKKPVLLKQDKTNYFLSEEQRNKIVSYYLAYGNYFNDDIGLACKKAIEKYGIQLANEHRAKIIPQELNQYCSAEVIEEIDDIDRNHYRRHDIDFYKNNDPSQKYAYVINVLTWETSRGRWGNVEVPDEKTMEKLIPRDVWSIFMAE